MIFVARHAEADWDADPIDPPLTTRGADQAARMGAASAGLGLCRIRSSPLRRAGATADAISARCAVPCLWDPRLVEYSGAEARDAWEARQQAVWRDVRPPPGELWVAHGGILDAILRAWRVTLPARPPMDRHGSGIACGEIWSIDGREGRCLLGEQ
jgi:broad specificity phosphatase PhoE